MLIGSEGFSTLIVLCRIISIKNTVLDKEPSKVFRRTEGEGVLAKEIIKKKRATNGQYTASQVSYNFMSTQTSNVLVFK